MSGPDGMSKVRCREITADDLDAVADLSDTELAIYGP